MVRENAGRTFRREGEVSPEPQDMVGGLAVAAFSGWRNDGNRGDQGRFLPDGSETSVNIVRGAGERWAHVSAERNATLSWFNTVSASEAQARRHSLRRIAVSPLTQTSTLTTVRACICSNCDVPWISDSTGLLSQ